MGVSLRAKYFGAFPRLSAKRTAQVRKTCLLRL